MENKFLYIKEQCKDCGGKGYIWSPNRFIFGQEEKDPIQCECLKKMMLYTHLHNANIPREYYDLTMNDFKVPDEDGDVNALNQKVEKAKVKPIVQRAIDNIDTMFREGRGLFLYGTNGTGKTMLSIEILKAALRSKYSIHYEMFPIVNETFLKKGYKADEAKERLDNIFANIDFLVLDEVGKELDGSPALISSKLLEIHVLRKRVDKVTILISNKSEDEISDIYGPSIKSMLRLKHKFVQVSGYDFRGDKKTSKLEGSTND